MKWDFASGANTSHYPNGKKKQRKKTANCIKRFWDRKRFPRCIFLLSYRPCPGIRTSPVNSSKALSPVVISPRALVILVLTSVTFRGSHWGDLVGWGCVLLGRDRITWSRGLCNVGYSSEIHLKLKSREVSFVHNFHMNCPIVLKFRTQHDSITALFSAQFQNYWVTEKPFTGKPDFARF